MQPAGRECSLESDFGPAGDRVRGMLSGSWRASPAYEETVDPPRQRYELISLGCLPLVGGLLGLTRSPPAKPCESPKHSINGTEITPLSSSAGWGHGKVHNYFQGNVPYNPPKPSSS
jgi:hypothetical protein